MEQEKNNLNYELKSDAVEALAGTDGQPTPEYSKEELERYRGKKKFKIPGPVKILFVKAWFSGAVCFFILWGLGAYLRDLLDQLVITGIVLGLCTDLLVNHVICFLEAYTGQYEEWMLMPKKGMGSFFGNLIYGFVLTFGVYMIYAVINSVIKSITGDMESVPLGVEPILFGLFTMGVDMLCIGIKRLWLSILEDAKNAAGKHE